MALKNSTLIGIPNNDYEKSELVIGLVSALGTNLDKVQLDLEQQLVRFDYNVNIIKLSDFLSTLKLKTKLDDTTEFKRIDTYMTAGDEARQKAGRGDLLALMAVSKIYENRPMDSNNGSVKIPQPKKAHILKSLKHPIEVQLLQAIYGSGFWLIGVHSYNEQRLKYLVEIHNMSNEEAQYLMKRDYLERGNKFGQRTSDTFHRADVFVREGDIDSLSRFFDLLFSHPRMTPKLDEQAMFFAHAAAMRSGSLSRQVGASIVNKNEDLIALGVNEVPSYGGGLFWPKEENKDLRDCGKDRDPSIEHLERLIKDVANRLGRREDEVKDLLKDSEIQDLTEFQRAVHAEMEALLACARSETSPQGGTLYSTVFPCHICAKHIVAAGIKRVVYIEPYPKSRALELLSDFIVLDADEEGKVIFESFVGIGPRRYVDLFSTVAGTGRPLKRRDSKGKPSRWEADTAPLRLKMLPSFYIEREGVQTKNLEEIMKQIQEKEGNNV